MRVNFSARHDSLSGKRHEFIVLTRLLGIAPTEALLWTHGSVRGISPRQYFQGARSTPRPLRLVRHAGRGPWDESAFAILALSKMDWNNDALYDPLPVTLEYAKIVPTKNQKYETRAKACESARLLRGLVKVPGGT